jgi:hypothetical protein
VYEKLSAEFGRSKDNFSTCNLGKTHCLLFQFAAHSILDGSMSEYHNSAPTSHTQELFVNLLQHPSVLLCSHDAAPVTAQDKADSGI